MEDLDRKEYVANLAEAKTENEKKSIIAGELLTDIKISDNLAIFPDFEAKELNLRRRSLGNIRFIGELYKIRMLNGDLNKILRCFLHLLLIRTYYARVYPEVTGSDRG